MRLLERFDRRTVAATFRDFRPSLFFGVPTMYASLLECDLEISHEIGSSMRLFVSGSAPLPVHVLKAFSERFGHTIVERYGMTEALMIMSNPHSGERRAGTVGLPLPGVSVRLLNGELQPVKTGEAGEIYVKGPNVFPSYWRREDVTRQAFVEGYFRTGDLATCSTDGYYTLCGRRHDLIISGGFNIFPREIEEFLEECPGVAEAAVVGIPDRVCGEIPIAFLVLDGPVSISSIVAHCQGKLAPFKTPHKFTIVDKLPRNAMGKIQKHLLQSEV